MYNTAGSKDQNHVYKELGKLCAWRKQMGSWEVLKE